MKMIFFTLESFVLLSVFTLILQFKITHRKKRIIAAIITYFIWNICLLLYEVLFPSTLISLLIILILFEEAWYSKLCWSWIIALFINVFSNIINYILCIFKGTTSYNGISDGITVLGIILFTLWTSKKFSYRLLELTQLCFKDYALLSAVAIVDFFLSAISSLLLTGYINTLERYLMIFAILLIIIMNIILIFSYFRLKSYHALLQQSHKMNQNALLLEQKHYEELQRKNMDLRSFRHDYNHHITAMQAIAQNNDWESLKNYLYDLSTVKEQINYISTNNSVADAIINYFYEHKAKEINFKVEGKFIQNLLIAESDLCTVLSNLLKNAMDAVSKETISEKNIYLEISSDDRQTIILVENNSQKYSAEELKKLNTSKPNALNHGFGIKNIQNTAEKYHGKLDLQWKNGIFSACVLLKNPKERIMI